MHMLPGFAVGLDMLSCSEHFSTVYTGAISKRHTVSKVILILVTWTITATITCHAGTLEIKPKEFFLARGW